MTELLKLAIDYILHPTTLSGVSFLTLVHLRYLIYMSELSTPYRGQYLV